MWKKNQFNKTMDFCYWCLPVVSNLLYLLLWLISVIFVVQVRPSKLSLSLYYKIWNMDTIKQVKALSSGSTQPLYSVALVLFSSLQFYFSEFQPLAFLLVLTFHYNTQQHTFGWEFEKKNNGYLFFSFFAKKNNGSDTYFCLLVRSGYLPATVAELFCSESSEK